MCTNLHMGENKETGLYKIIVIIGKSRSGKDTIARYLDDIHKVKPIVSYATRPKRDNETDGVEHKFISKKEMENVKKNEKMIAYTINKKTGYEYCSTLDSFKPDEWRTYILNPEGLYYLVAHMSKETFLHVVYVDCDEDILRQRGVERNESPEIFEKRISSEREEFDYFRDNHDNLINGMLNSNNYSIDQLPGIVDIIMEDANRRFDNYVNSYVFEGVLVGNYKVGENVYVDQVNHKDYFATAKIIDVIDDAKKFKEIYYVLDKFPDTIVCEEFLKDEIDDGDNLRLYTHAGKNFINKLLRKDHY